ncbi:MAG: CvpA family protein [Bacteroidales bacterium]|nr:CvpA family protein [Bacteroidales bacterium]
MSWIDIILIIILLWSAYKGFTKGFIITIASLAALILGIFGAIKLSGYTAEILYDKMEINPDNLNLIAFAITFILIVIATHIVARLTDKLVKAVALGFANRIAGVLFNLLKTALIISVILVILERIDEKIPFIPRSETNKSVLYKPLHSFAPFIFPYLRSGYDKIKNNLPERDEILADTRISNEKCRVLSL